MKQISIREFIAKRGQDPETFKSFLKKFGDNPVKREEKNQSQEFSDSIRDVRRFGDLVVMLSRRVYYRGYPGVRRENHITVLRDDGKLYYAKNVYVDGECGTFASDHPLNGFESVIDAQLKRSAGENVDHIVVRMEAEHARGLELCFPSSGAG